MKIYRHKRNESIALMEIVYPDGAVIKSRGGLYVTISRAQNLAKSLADGAQLLIRDVDDDAKTVLARIVMAGNIIETHVAL